MNCRKFEEQLADWVSGRLPEDRAAALEAHRALCPACAQAEKEERDLRARWLSLATPAAAPDLWPRIEARLHAPAPTPRFVFARRLAFGGAVAAAGALCALLWVYLSSALPHVAPPVAEADEGRVVQLVGTMQRLPDPDADIVTNEPRYSVWEERRFILMGGPGR